MQLLVLSIGKERAANVPAILRMILYLSNSSRKRIVVQGFRIRGFEIVSLMAEVQIFFKIPLKSSSFIACFKFRRSSYSSIR